MNRLLLCVTTVTLTKTGFMEPCVIDLRHRPSNYTSMQRSIFRCGVVETACAESLDNEGVHRFVMRTAGRLLSLVRTHVNLQDEVTQLFEEMRDGVHRYVLSLGSA